MGRPTLVSGLLVCALIGCDGPEAPDPLPEVGDWGDPDEEGSDTDGWGDTDPGDTDGSGPEYPDIPDDPDDPGSDPSDSGSEPDDPSQPGDDPCRGQAINLASQGYVKASSVYSTFLLGELYPAELAIDDDPTTSWFSKGPDVDVDGSTFEWYVQHNHCIDTITIVGNADNAEPSFQTGYGFHDVLVQVMNTSNKVVFEQEIGLDGTPDPTLEIDLQGKLAHRIVLTFTGHESLECGGFAELRIDGRPLE